MIVAAVLAAWAVNLVFVVASLTICFALLAWIANRAGK